MASRIHFKYWKNILISRLYEQFSRNDSPMAPEKIEHIIYSFEARDLEISEKLHEICFAHISAKFKYLAKQFILTESGHMLCFVF